MKKVILHKLGTRRCRTWFFPPRKNKDRVGIRFRWWRGERVIPAVVVKCFLAAFAFFIAYLMARSGVDGYGWVIFAAILIGINA